MNFYILLLFLGGPLILAFGNLVLGPMFNKAIPFHIQMRSFFIGAIVYLLGATVLYYLILRHQF